MARSEQSEDPGPSPSSQSSSTCQDSGLHEHTRYRARYCTPHAKVPGVLSVSPEIVRFKPDADNRHTKELGVEQYQVLVEVRDVLECGAMAMPFEGKNGALFFMQLHLRTLDGVEFRNSEDVQDPWRVVFQLGARDQLYEAAQIVLDATPVINKTVANHTSSNTSVPFACLDCFAEFEAVLHAPRPAPAQPSGGSGRTRPAALLQGLSSFLRPGNQSSSSTAQPEHQPRKRHPRASANIAIPKEPAGTAESKAVGTGQESADLPAPQSPASPSRSHIVLRPGVTPSDHTLLTVCMAECISEYLPVSLRLPGAVEWVLSYSPRAHGVSLATLYRNLEDFQFTVVIVRDSEGAIFGGFAPASWEPKGKFFGSGEAFMFRFTDTRDPQIEIYPSTAQNNYFMYADKSLLAMGGGDGRHALVVQSDILRGSSAPTATFGNPKLSISEEFVVRDIEFWVLEEVEYGQASSQS